MNQEDKNTVREAPSTPSPMDKSKITPVFAITSREHPESLPIIRSNRKEAQDVAGHGWLPSECPFIIEEGFLVIGPDRPYTKEEVEKMLRDLLSAAEDGPYVPNYERMEECAAKNGFKLT